MTKPFILAPIRGVTGYQLRTAFTRHFGGFDAALAPFVATTPAEKIGTRHFRDIRPEVNDLLSITPQLIGKSGEDFVRMAKALETIGYRVCNWNLGCPHPVVTRKKRGSGLLPEPDHIRAFLDTVCRELPGRISIKTRLGLSDPDELLRLLPVLNEYPLQQLIIHPRTGHQLYRGCVDLDRYGQCLAASRHPVIYNGDIVNEDSFAYLREHFPGTAGWMIGRGALMDPFLPLRLRGQKEEAAEAVDRTIGFHQEVFEGYVERYSAPRAALGALKELWQYLAQAFLSEPKLLKKIRKSQTFAAYTEAVNAFFSTARWAPSWRSHALPFSETPPGTTPDTDRFRS